MKLLLLHIALTILNQAFSQQLSTNLEIKINDTISPNLSKSQTSVECHDSSFWSLDPQNNILEWELVGGAVTFRDTVFKNSPISSLAFANNMNSTGTTKTFYGSDGYNLIYFDGTNWDTIAGLPSFSYIGNCGAYQNFLYYMVSTTSAFPNMIYRYDGINLSLIVTLPVGQSFSVADLAVDENGNIWVVTQTGGVGSIDSLRQYSPSGTLLNTYSFFSSLPNGVYGAFMMNGNYFLGFASGSNPNTLAEYIINGNSAIINNYYPFYGYNDLASCVAGSITFSTNYIKPSNLLSVFPNPSSGEIRITLPDEVKYPVEISITDIVGKKIWSEKINISKILSIEDLSPGIYIVNLEGTNYVQMLIRK